MPLEKRQELFKLVQFIKAAPFRSVLAFVILLPLFLFSLTFAIIIAGYVLEFVLTFLLYGLSELAAERDHDLVFSHVTWPAKFCWSTMTFMTFGEGPSLFLIFPYAFAAFWLLGSVSRDLRKRYPDGPLIFRWFQKNEQNLMANDYSPELSCGRADEIVQSYADVLATGGRGRIGDASLLPYDKETIRAAIDRLIECLVEQHDGHDLPPTPELEKTIGTLAAVKWELFDFQEIDPEDKEAVTILNPCKELSRPEFFEDSDWYDFLRWQNLIVSKYSQRASIEIERLAAGDKTITVKRQGSHDAGECRQAPTTGSTIRSAGSRSSFGKSRSQAIVYCVRSLRPICEATGRAFQFRQIYFTDCQRASQRVLEITTTVAFNRNVLRQPNHTL